MKKSWQNQNYLTFLGFPWLYQDLYEPRTVCKIRADGFSVDLQTKYFCVTWYSNIVNSIPSPKTTKQMSYAYTHETKTTFHLSTKYMWKENTFLYQANPFKISLTKYINKCV